MSACPLVATGGCGTDQTGSTAMIAVPACNFNGTLLMSVSAGVHFCTKLNKSVPTYLPNGSYIHVTLASPMSPYHSHS